MPGMEISTPPLIPDGEFLFRYAKPEAFPEGQTDIPVGIFQDNDLSCDWERYQKSPDRSFHIAEGRNVIIRITVCDEIRNPTNPKRTGQRVADWAQEIIHDPIKKGQDVNHLEMENISHSLIRGRKRAAVVKAIADNSIIYTPQPQAYNIPVSRVDNYMRLVMPIILIFIFVIMVVWSILYGILNN